MAPTQRVAFSNLKPPTLGDFAGWLLAVQQVQQPLKVVSRHEATSGLSSCSFPWFSEPGIAQKIHQAGTAAIALAGGQSWFKLHFL